MSLNIAVLGPGKIAENELVPALGEVPRAKLWSVLSRDERRAAAFARSHGAGSPQPAYTDLNAVLRDPDLHAVIIASPDRLHAEQAMAAARAGKHVLVEKPMATELADARAMIDACGEAGVKLAVAYHMRWHAGHRKLADAVRADALGTLRHLHVQWAFRASDSSNWRASVEVGRWWSLAGVGTHCLDQIRWYMLPTCGEIVHMQSLITRDVWGGPHDETALLSFKFESGATASLCSSVLFSAPQRLELYGSGGYAICDDTLGAHGKGKVRTHRGAMPFESANPYVGEIQDFVDAILEDREPEVGGEEGLRNVELLLRADSQA